ncbi:MAG: hypothetical protein F4146_08605 [Rhodothermaceae bacterium]|nr:hypothetical protein [Rhodothermaceae bacterium]MXX58060.1 hypothetical protein [Rhodothermaceae bacterium]MXZ05540.1 hypothetical protein [Rhodothermaceae bacterium]MYD18612.1 hypothetical protein [Rhodothermaceae bacterium]MYD57407.1 hypothetical protein [Rhodothermaceae bacterium]
MPLLLVRPSTTSSGLKRDDAEDLYEAMDYLVEREGAVEYRLAKRHLREGATALCEMTRSHVEGEHNERAKWPQSGQIALEICPIS